MKQFLLRLYYFASLSKQEADRNQKEIRNVEWDAIKDSISKGGKFLDVGCGAGYAMRKAKEEFGCQCFGIDPDPGAHGVGRYDPNSPSGLDIVQGFAESLPYADNEFDVVYCSHVLEHVNDEKKSLEEIKRVLKPGGTLIIGMPTAAMAWINFLSEILFTSHQRFVNVFFRPFIKVGKTDFINLFVPRSHSYPRAKTLLYDLRHYRVKNWKETVSGVFTVDKTLLPALYPYPQYWQLFSMKKNFRFSSSVFFICHK